jgi:hypothetical protein
MSRRRTTGPEANTAGSGDKLPIIALARAVLTAAPMRSLQLLVPALFLIPHLACTAAAPDTDTSSEAEDGAPDLDLGEAESAISPTRLVPLRLVHVIAQASCTTASKCTPNESNVVMRDAVDRANGIYAPAGIKLWIKSEELIPAPNLATSLSTTFTFAAVKTELRRIFPAMPTNAYLDGESKTVKNWLDGAAVMYGNPNEILAYIIDGSGQSLTHYPERGRSATLVGANIVASAAGAGTTEVVSAHFAHELGHFFGVRHPTGNIAGTNPWTGDPWEERDRWDLLVCADGSFFGSPSAVDDCDAPLTIYEGCFTSPSYSGTPQCFTPSGLRTANAYLQAEVVIDPANMANYLSLGVSAPAGASPFYPWGLRSQLGLITNDDFVSFSNAKIGHGSRFTFASRAAPVNGTNYTPVSGDFDADGRDDILFYDPTSTWVVFWWGQSDGGFTVDSRSGFFPETGYQVFTGDFDGNGATDIFMYKPGAGQERIRRRTTARNFTTSATDTLLTVGGTYTPIVGDFDGNGRDDVYWYSPAGAQVNRWFFNGSNGSFTFTAANFVPVPPGGPFLAIAGDFDGNGSDDVFWYLAGGAASEKLWYGPQTGSGAAVTTTSNVAGDYEPLAADFDGDGRTDIVWDAKTFATDFVWAGTVWQGVFEHGGDLASGATHSGRLSLSGAFDPVAGDFNGDGAADVLWYRE